MHTQSRRHFLKNAAILSPVLTFLPSYLTAGTGSMFRIAFIGTGKWGQEYLKQTIQHKDLDLRALHDTNPASISQSLQIISQAGYRCPDVYYDNYQTLLSRQDIDAVIIAAPANQHYSIAKAALLAGKHVACGAVMGTTLEEHEDIVRICEETGRQYFTLDEHSYRSDLVAVTNMVQKGVFGELKTLYAGACCNSLQPVHDKAALSYPVYPGTAVARILDTQKNNAFESLQVLRQQQQYVINKPCPKTGRSRLFFTSGTISSICLTTRQGQKVWLQMDAGKKQPVSTGFRIDGNKGSWIDITNSIYLENNSPNHAWDAAKPVINQYAQVASLSRYKKAEENNSYAMALQEFVDVMEQRNELAVYTAATNSVIAPMAALSARRNGAAVQFPQFRNPIL